jgi:hypothetical protein
MVLTYRFTAATEKGAQLAVQAGIDAPRTASTSGYELGENKGEARNITHVEEL